LAVNQAKYHKKARDQLADPWLQVLIRPEILELSGFPAWGDLKRVVRLGERRAG
jgi:hypothetical protein